MSDNDMISGHIIETGKSAFAVTINVSGFELVGDEPVSAGGGALGPSPYDLLVAALGECTAMTVRWYARRQSWPLDKVEVKMTHSKREVAGTETKASKIDVFTKEIILHGDSLTEDQRAKLLDVAGKCPVQRSLLGTPVIKTTLATS
jgi:putative redox protein